MKKYLTFLVLVISIFIFKNNVKAEENKIFTNYTTYESEHIEYYFTSNILESNFYTDYNKFDTNARKTSSKSQMNNIKNAIDNNTYSEYGKYYMVITEDASNYNYLIYFNDINDFTFVKSSPNQLKPYCVDCVAIRFDQGSISKPTRYINNFPTSTYDLIIYDDNSLHVGFNYKKYIYFSSEDVYNAFFEYNYMLPPEIKYEIVNGTERGKMLKIYFYNFSEGDNGILTNFQTGKKYIFPSMPLSPTFTLDNINLDNSFTFNAYDKDKNLILTETIDIQNEIAKLNDERYIEIFNLNTTRLNDYFVTFHNTYTTDKCYVKINNSPNTGETELDCYSEFADIYSPRNTFVENYIKNEKGEIVVKKVINLNYIKDLPIIEFESSFNDNESRQELKIILNNYENNDKFYYSYDNEYWELLETKRINYLYFYSDSEVYFKVVRDDEIVSEAYFDVVYNSFSNSSNNNNLEEQKSLKGLLKYFKSLTNEISFEPFLNGVKAYELLKNSKFGLYILLVLTSSIIILVIKSLKR